MDKSYWNNYYQSHGQDKEIVESSSFAQFILNNYLQKKKFKIIELGSGNGRDAIFFAHHCHNIIAIDQSKIAMDVAKKKIEPSVLKYFHPMALDFVLEDYTKYKNIDLFYSRFTLHSITKSNELVLLPKVYNSLKENGLFCIEARTTKDPLFGIGKACGKNTYINDNHKRRFIDTDDFRKQVSKLGFKEIYFIEKNNLSVVKKDNPTLMRIVLQK